ncbi:2OG-Fe dioxygenase family protein [Kitasatospora sp. NPDC057541]|uniref:2OG-Fe dioxygenase family protein n=1 Tax=unclassified Kitasatospora TaxID=2633591 RepID=UPI0036A24B77
MNESSQPAGALEIGERGYVHSRFGTVIGPEFIQGTDWKLFADSWNSLSRDGYMSDGGTYRERRYSEFSHDAAQGRTALLPHVPYSQTKEINYLNGGIERHFDPFERHVAESPVLNTIFQWCADILARTTGTAHWKVQSFQNRILARSTEAGQPTPEGIHRDGVDFVLTLLVGRESIDGGTSALYDARTRECRAEVLLTEPGEFLFADDEKMVHGVTPLTPARPGGQGHRDVLIAMFTRADG